MKFFYRLLICLLLLVTAMMSMIRDAGADTVKPIEKKSIQAALPESSSEKPVVEGESDYINSLPSIEIKSEDVILPNGEHSQEFLDRLEKERLERNDRHK